MARDVFQAERQLDEIDEALGKKFRVLDPAKVAKSVEGAMDALNRALAELKVIDFNQEIDCGWCKKPVRARLSPRDLAQVTAYVAKVVDQVYRLSEFAAGRPDSRPEHASAESLLEVITNEQLATLMGWVEAAKARGAGAPPKGTVLQ